MRLPLLVTAMFKSVCGAWCAAHRFQAVRGLCRYGCGQVRGDCIRHYLCCPIFLEWRSGFMATPLGDDFLTLLGLRPDMTDRDVVLCAIAIYTAFVTFESLRARAHIGNKRETTLLMLGKLRHLRLTHRPVVQILDDVLWHSFSARVQERYSRRRRRRT